MKKLFENFKNFIIEGEVVPFRKPYDMDKWEQFIQELIALSATYGFQDIQADYDNYGQLYITVYTNLIKGQDLADKAEGVPSVIGKPPDMPEENKLYWMTDEDFEDPQEFKYHWEKEEEED